MTFSESVSTCFRKYATFEGRASRSEYWWFVLFSAVLGAIPALDAIAGIVLFIPGMAVCCRRLHDRGKSGWMQAGPLGLVLLGFFSAAAFGGSVFMVITMILAPLCMIWLFVECARKGMPGPNQYGPPAVQEEILCPNCSTPCRQGEPFCPRCGTCVTPKNY